MGECKNDVSAFDQLQLKTLWLHLSYNGQFNYKIHLSV